MGVTDPPCRGCCSHLQKCVREDPRVSSLLRSSSGSFRRPFWDSGICQSAVIWDQWWLLSKVFCHTYMYNNDISLPWLLWAECLNPYVATLGADVWRVGLGKVTRFGWDPESGVAWWVSVLVAETGRAPSLPPSPARTQRRQPSAPLNSAPTTSRPRGSLASDFQPPGLWEVSVCCWCHPGHGLLLQEPERRKLIHILWFTSVSSKR